MDTKATGSGLGGGIGSKPASLFGILLLGGLFAFGGIQASGTPDRRGAGDTPEADSEAHRMEPDQQPDDRVILITGSTSGLGREVALRLAGRGAHIIVHGRNVERGREVVRQIEEETPGSAAFYRADLASNAEINALADQILEDYDRLDVLLNNAGIYLSPEGRILSEDGYELRFHVNYLSHFLLTDRLLPLLRQSAPARIVNVASAAQAPVDFDDVMLEEGYSDSRAYAQSKLAQILFTFELAERLEGSGISVNTLHPATLMNTPMVEEAGARPRSTVDEGAEAVLQLVNEDVGSGRYFNGLNPTRPHDQAYDQEARDRLWELSEDLAGLD